MKGYIAGMVLWVVVMQDAYAGQADVVDVRLSRQAQGVYHIDVTVRHADEGWAHYVNRWDVLTPDGTVLGTRTLYHPHVQEQPFTRSLTDLKIPPKVKHVIVRAHDSVHAYSGKTMTVAVPLQ